MIFRLPTPPSVNGLYLNVPGRGRVKTAEYKAWLKDADAWYAVQHLKQYPTMIGPLELHIRLPKVRGDISNRIKAAEDYCVSRKITGDDKNNIKVSIEVDHELSKFECWVTVKVAQQNLEAHQVSK